MPTIPLGINDWASPLTNVSRIRLRNMYIVDNPLSPDGMSRISRPVLSTFSNVGTGPIQAIWQQDGTLNGDFFVVSGDKLYRLSDTISTYIGDIPGYENPIFAGNTSQIVIVRDGNAYVTDGISLTTLEMPDGYPVQSVDCIDSTFILPIQNTQLFYWLNPGETTPDGLNFASAERKPDPIETVAIVSDEIWFLGTQTMEVWTATGNNDAPYVRITGRAYKDGCASKQSVVKTVYDGLPCLIWVTDTNTVVLAQGKPNRVSNDAIEEALRGATDFVAWGFRQNRHDFYVLSCSKGTFAFDIKQGNWSVWDSYGKDYFRGQTAAQSGTTILVGDKESNAVYLFAEGGADAGDPVIREVSGFVVNQGNQQPVNSVNLRLNVGWTSSDTDEDVIEVRWSDDLGVTFSSYMAASTGKAGEYSKDVTFRSLGVMFRPGREFEFRYSGPNQIRLDYATINEV